MVTPDVQYKNQQYLSHHGNTRCVLCSVASHKAPGTMVNMVGIITSISDAHYSTQAMYSVYT